MLTEISRLLLAWYQDNARRLPWRGRIDSYAVWISEIMLQQTQVETVIPYFQRWMERFPTLATCAAASEQDILQAWEGLGYYSRARNIHRAARIMMERFNGQVPASRKALMTLPGIGAYTAAAVSSIAFNQDETALDGNIQRVYARLYALKEPLNTPLAQERLSEYATSNLPPGQAGDYNQALMDLGAAICTARSPRCPLCPLAQHCQARQQGMQQVLPLKTPRLPQPHITVTAAVIQRGGQVLIARRPSKGLLGGMWEFPGGKLEPAETLEACLVREIKEEMGVKILVKAEFGVYQHAYTHFRVTLHAFLCELAGGEPVNIQAAQLAWVEPQRLADFPMGKIDRQIAARLAGSQQAG